MLSLACNLLELSIFTRGETNSSSMGYIKPVCEQLRSGLNTSRFLKQRRTLLCRFKDVVLSGWSTEPRVIFLCGLIVWGALRGTTEVRLDAVLELSRLSSDVYIFGIRERVQFINENYESLSDHVWWLLPLLKSEKSYFEVVWKDFQGNWHTFETLFCQTRPLNSKQIIFSHNSACVYQHLLT